MNIRLMYFNKRFNSTKIPYMPSIQYEEYEGKIRDNCSITSPIVAFNFGVMNDTPSFNYAKIDQFNRFYFINDWTFEGGLWVASMSEDVLASFKDGIIRSSQYVVRSSSKKNGYLTDSQYPATTSNSTTEVFFEDGNFNYGGRGGLTYSTIASTQLYNGRFVVSVNNGNPSNSSTTSYYELSGAGMYSFLHKIFDYNPTGFGDIGAGLAKQLANPIQYINRILWYPTYVCPVTEPIRTVDIPLGFYTMTGLDGREIDPLIVARSACGGVIDIPKHPQASSRGQYMNISPYSNYTLWLDPFGSITIDSTKMIDSTRLSIVWVNDISNGIGNLYLTTPEGGVIAKTRAKTGIELSLTQNSIDIMGALTSGVNAVPNIMTKNVIGAAAGVVNSVFGAIVPQSSTVGGDGGFTIWSSLAPRLQAQFINAVPRDNEKFGSPLCDTETLSNLSGFCQCEDAKFYNSFALADEINSIESYLNSGVYLE